MTSRLMKAMCALLVAAILVPGQAEAQGGDGYLFKAPVVSFTLRTGYSMPRAGSELFTFTQEQLTVEKSDFYAPLLEGRVAVRVTDRVDVMGTIGGGASSVRSEFREWEDTEGLPIEQTTSFSTLRLTFGAKAYLVERGRSVGRFAWVPTKFAPYVGADAGWVFHEFKQEGDWVDYETLAIFSDRFYNDGKAPTVQALAGMDLSLNNRVLFNAEARYGWASDELGYDFVDFDKLDLAGFQVTAGFSVRF